MATTNPTFDDAPTAARSSIGLLVLVASDRPEQIEIILADLAVAFPSENLLIAGAVGGATETYSNFSFIESPEAEASWILTPANFVSAYELARTNGARAILMLGDQAGSLRADALCDLAHPVLAGDIDLALPRYALPPHAGLLNSAILYPLSRALFATDTRFPLAIDLGLSIRMCECLATVAQRYLVLNQGDAPLWPVHEAAVAGFRCREFDVGARLLPQPAEPNLNAILPLVTGSLFSDIDAKAAFWQRARAGCAPRSPIPNASANDTTPDIGPMIEGFRLAFTNLREIWTLVLPPNSLLGLKRLSVADASAFQMPDGLWVRIVFDFLLAYRLRTINRGHLLGAMIPLYLAWVASHIHICSTGIDAEEHIAVLARAFEADKPYLVSRWRWPDRFSP